MDECQAQPKQEGVHIAYIVCRGFKSEFTVRVEFTQVERAVGRGSEVVQSGVNKS